MGTKRWRRTLVFAFVHIIVIVMFIVIIIVITTIAAAAHQSGNVDPTHCTDKQIRGLGASGRLERVRGWRTSSVENGLVGRRPENFGLHEEVLVLLVA